MFEYLCKLGHFVTQIFIYKEFFWQFEKKHPKTITLIYLQVTFSMCDVPTTWKESVRSRLDDVTQLANDVLKFETRKFLANQDEEFRRQLTSRFWTQSEDLLALRICIHLDNLNNH